MKRIWITWERHRRTSEIACQIRDLSLYVLTLEKASPLIRYFYLLMRTAWVLIRERPGLAIVQNPSIVLSLFTVITSKFVKFRVVVDAHNEGLKPFYPKHNLLLIVYRIIQKWSDLTIVTNPQLAEIVRKNGGNPFVLEDKIPELNHFKRLGLRGVRNLIFVCTFEKDEPYLDVIQAAEFVDPSVFIYITGRNQKASPDTISQAPPNIVFTGFLSDKDYINILYSCDVVIDLTLMQDCLVCGAYEAVALGKPVILSDTEALRNYFSQGAVYTENNPKKIAAAITYALRNREKLAKEIFLLRDKLERDWNKKFSNLVALLDELGRPG